MSALEQAIPEGYRQTEVGVIPANWKVSRLDELISFKNGAAHEDCINEYGDFVLVNSKFISTEGKVRKGSSECRQAAFKNDLLMVMSDVPNGKAIAKCFLVDQDNVYTVNQRICVLTPNHDVSPFFLLKTLSRNPYYLAFDDGAKQTNLRKEDVLSCLLVKPPIKEQTAIANALSDVDALFTELEKLIAKKQAIKTATMQQLLTGKTRLPQFATYTEGEKQGQLKGTKPSELGEIPEDWEVVTFGELFEQSISRKSLKADMTTTFVGMQDVSESARLIKQTPVIVSKVKSGFTYFERHDVLVAKITPCFENGKGCHTKKLDTEHGFGSTEFHVLRAKLNADSDFIYFWTTRDIFRQELESEMVGSAGHRRVPFSALQNYKIPCPDSKEEQTAIATILSDMDNEIQTLEQRLAKTRQIKQGMMQELLTGRTRLPLDKG
ncbi:restriction endonuclease subunit S [Aestuariibacter halophilus]|uniref:Restriction endonuclease subunit S n=1 Tax=Fluctibacter halophilus TaxID=226011 RepID=A0ABS8G7L2_9ALTE|nr:restriction endonuclease subunit S [Aestuariibacter halophilus]MCC2616513.1 restriction endonuclease subunit S [Aestuariibacter halophilus]